MKMFGSCAVLLLSLTILNGVNARSVNAYQNGNRKAAIQTLRYWPQNDMFAFRADGDRKVRHIATKHPVALPSSHGPRGQVAQKLSATTLESPPDVNSNVQVSTAPSITTPSSTTPSSWRKYLHWPPWSARRMHPRFRHSKNRSHHSGATSWDSGAESRHSAAEGHHSGAYGADSRVDFQPLAPVDDEAYYDYLEHARV